MKFEDEELEKCRSSPLLFYVVNVAGYIGTLRFPRKCRF